MSKPMKVFCGGDGKNLVIGAFASLTAFCKASGFNRAYCGETGNLREVAIATLHPGRLLGRGSSDHHGKYRFYEGRALGRIASGQEEPDPELKAGLEARQTAPLVGPFILTPSLASKIGSIIAHVDEFTTEDGHEFDVAAFRALMWDDDVVAWLKSMKALALIPVKRR